MKIKLKSKAATLEALGDQLSFSSVLPLYKFSVADYVANESYHHEKISSKFDGPVIVRSSSEREDNMNFSNAGSFDSILNVSLNDHTELCKAIHDVAARLTNTDEIFIQQMMNDVELAGVVFTCDLDTLAPYYLINIDRSGSTSSVTSGTTNNLETHVLFKQEIEVQDPLIQRIIDAARELEVIFDNDKLDIEFAVIESEIYIFQVRAIVVRNKTDLSGLNYKKALNKISSKYKKLNMKHPNLLGDKTLFGVMPDWNPAEIIGLRPKRLALSLYKELVTDQIWAYQRDNYGYRNLRSHPLLVSFYGLPYIDVRVSFNSFIPKELNEEIANRLANFYLESLVSNSKAHDKVEFDIVFSCYYFNIDEDTKILLENGFSSDDVEEITRSLRDLTNKIISSDSQLFNNDLRKVDILTARRHEIIDSNLPLIDRIYWLVQDVKRYGTLPFAGVARAAFIGIKLLKSLVSANVFTASDSDRFMESIETVSKRLSKNVYKDLKSIADEYGHLRPGTYNILSEPYRDALSSYFRVDAQAPEAIADEVKVEFMLSTVAREKIVSLLKHSGLNTDADGLLLFIRRAIEGREFLKFEFTKHTDLILSGIEELGRKNGISKDLLAHVDISSILEMYSSLDEADVRDQLMSSINKNKSCFDFTKSIRLPPLISDPSEIFSHCLSDDVATFISQKVARAEVVTGDLAKLDLEGKIVCIEAADPGYDFLFSKGIAGLITCFGGANSHMAIRCAEIGLPAVIGCGPKLFSEYCMSNVLEIDAVNQKVIKFYA